MPKAQAQRLTMIGAIGHDGFALLRLLDAPEAPLHLRTRFSVVTLRQIWLQQYYGPHDVRWRSEADATPRPAADVTV